MLTEMDPKHTEALHCCWSLPGDFGSLEPVNFFIQSLYVTTSMNTDSYRTGEE